ncbi:MAG: class I SAM-dependent methyltransferase [Hydrogenophilaceae bacterium]|jgi:hypothetical protein|nr:class I SAM-dependent methyltransferase [Hydrogenophilaceae bacterium]
MTTYEDKVRRQIEQYRDLPIHDLPEIFHVWSHKYLRPLIESVFARSSIAEIYADHIGQSFKRTGNHEAVSLGAGEASMEIDVAKHLLAAGEHDFRIHCFELSDHLIGRGQANARAAGVQDHIVYNQADLNSWRPTSRYAAFMANHSLHHFVELETIFSLVADAMEPEGRFITNDMIGRNGHMRWPETRTIVDYFWRQLPESFKYHHQLRRFEAPDFMDWDCSGEGFEGIRAQDILPLLIRHFGFTHFAAWGGAIDIFIDRGFGHNYSKNNPEHIAFIDTLETVNSAMLAIGFIKPTQMLAVTTLDKDAPCITHNGMTPAKAMRDPTVPYEFMAPKS